MEPALPPFLAVYVLSVGPQGLREIGNAFTQGTLAKSTTSHAGVQGAAILFGAGGLELIEWFLYLTDVA